MVTRRSLYGAGHVLGAAGFYKTSRVVRAASMMGVGTSVTGTSSGLAGIAVAAAPVVAALGGIVIAAKLVEVGLGALSETASSVVGALAQIGGARGLQAMLVESSSAERQAANIATNAADRVSMTTVLQTMDRISSQSEFNKKDVGEMLRGFIGKRGSFAEAQQLAGFGANLASVSGMTPGESGALLGQLRVQFSELSMEQTKLAAAQLWSMGKQGAVELKDTTSITQALGFARAVSPNLLAGLGLEMGMVQAAQRFTGGQTSAQSVTGVRRLQEQLLSDPNSKKGQNLRALLGQDYLTHDEEGRAVLRNAPQTMAKISLAAFEDKPGISSAIESRSAKALRGFVSGEMGQQLIGKTEKEKVAILEDFFKKMEITDSHLEELNGALMIVKDTAEYQLKRAFNDLSNNLEAKFLPILKDAIPSVERFAKTLVDNKEDIAKYLSVVTNGLKELGATLPALLTLLKPIVSSLEHDVSFLAKIEEALGLITPKTPPKHPRHLTAPGEKPPTGKLQITDLPEDAKNAALQNFYGISDEKKQDTDKDKKTYEDKADKSRQAQLTEAQKQTAKLEEIKRILHIRRNDPPPNRATGH